MGLVGSLTLALSLFLGACGQAKIAGGGTPQDFYKDKTVRFIAATTAGGGDDLHCRTLAPYLQEFLGARSVAVENNAEAGEMAAMNITWTAPPDGLTIVARVPNSMVVAEITNEAGIQFKADEFQVIGGMTTEIGNFVTVSAKSPYKTVADLQKAKEVKFGGPYGKSMTAAYFADVLGLNARITPGLSTGDARLALLRGETDYFVESPGGAADATKKGDVVALVGDLDKKHVAMPNVPPITDFAKNLTQQQKDWMEFMRLTDSGKWLFTGPKVPKDRVEYLRSVFEKIMKDPRYLDERAKKLQRWPVMEPWLTGAQAQQNIHEYKVLAAKIYKPLNDYVSKKYYTVK